MYFRFSSRKILLLFLIVGAGLAYWQHGERVKLTPLCEARDQALTEWRVAKKLYDAQGPQFALDEALARAKYFECRDLLDSAVATSWWPGHLHKPQSRP